MPAVYRFWNVVTGGHLCVRHRGAEQYSISTRFLDDQPSTRSWSPAVRAVFIYADFTAPNTEANFDIVWDGLTCSSLSAASFVVSSS